MSEHPNLDAAVLGMRNWKQLLAPSQDPDRQSTMEKLFSGNDFFEIKVDDLLVPNPDTQELKYIWDGKDGYVHAYWGIHVVDGVSNLRLHAVNRLTDVNPVNDSSSSLYNEKLIVAKSVKGTFKLHTKGEEPELYFVRNLAVDNSTKYAVTPLLQVSDEKVYQRQQRWANQQKRENWINSSQGEMVALFNIPDHNINKSHAGKSLLISVGLIKEEDSYSIDLCISILDTSDVVERSKNLVCPAPPLNTPETGDEKKYQLFQKVYR